MQISLIPVLFAVSPNNKFKCHSLLYTSYHHSRATKLAKVIKTQQCKTEPGNILLLALACQNDTNQTIIVLSRQLVATFFHRLHYSLFLFLFL